MKNQALLVLVVTASILSFSPSSFAFNVVFGNRDTEDVRTEFTNSLNTNSSSTVIDDGMNPNFGAAPTPINTNLASVTRNGTIGGEAFNYTIYDIDFSDNPTGTITPGIVGNDIDDTDSLQVETPASQEDATGDYTWGVDGRTGNFTSGAALFDFTSRSIGHFGVDLHDFEAGEGISPSNTTSGAEAEIRIYQAGNLVFNYPLTFPGPAGGGSTDQPGGSANDSLIPGYGNRQSMFVGITANNPSEFFDQVVFVLGDDDVDTVGVASNTNDGSTEQWAADGFTFGAAYEDPTAVPFEFSPTLGFFIVSGLWVSNKIKQKLN